MNVARAFIIAGIFAIALGFYLSRGVKDGGLNALPEVGDGHDYDALAFNLWQYHRFGYDWNNLRWREPYLNHTEYDDLLTRHSAYYPTTYKQPAVPLVMAAVFAATNRSFAAWRIVNCGFTAGAVAIAAAISDAMAGPAAAVITAIVALTLPLPTFFSYQFMTEGLSALLVTWLVWRLVLNERRDWTTGNAVGAGLILGALMATRNIFVLCLPVVLIAPGVNRRSGVRQLWPDRAVCLLAALLVIAPWWVRNTAVLHAFMPLGTQGALNMPAGFGPRALRFDGMWTSNPGDGSEEVEALHLDPVQSEVQLARIRSKMTTDWMRSHPLDVLHLMWLHVWQEIRPRSDPYPTGAWLLPVAAVAALVLLRAPGVAVIAAITFVNLTGIALTWSVAGRFMTPIQPMLAALVGALIAVIARRLTVRGDTARSIPRMRDDEAPVSG